MKNWLPILQPFFVSRSLILLILFMTSQAHLIHHRAWEGEVISPHVELGSKEILPNLKPIAMSGDARWYLEIAENGYDFSNLTINKSRNWVFFPLAPLLINFFSKIVGSRILAGIILSNLCFLLFLKTLSEICRDERMDEAESQRVMWLVCFFPVSYFFSMPLTESLFALLLASSFLLLKRREFLPASLTLALCALTRPTGILILPAFALTLWLNSNLTLKRFILFYLPTGIALLGLISFWYLKTGDPIAFVSNQTFWDRGGSAVALIRNLFSNPIVLFTGWNFSALNFTILLACVTAIFHFWKQKEWDFAALILIPLVTIVSTGSIMSAARIVMPLFPFLIFLSRKTDRPWMEKTVLLIFAATLGIMTLLYALHITSAMA